MKKVLTSILFITLIFLPWVSSEAQPKEILEEAKTLIESLDQLENAGKYEEAIPYAKKLLEIAEKELTEDDPAIANVLNRLAALYRFTGRYAEAERLYNRALEKIEKALGKDHPYVAASLLGLALLYQNTGRYEEAIPYAERLLDITERTLGKEHPEVANTLTILGDLYLNTGKYAEAETLFKGSLEIREQALDKDHPNIGTSLIGLARIYKTTGRYTEAEPLYNRALAINENILGKNHLNIAIILDDIGELYSNLGKHTEEEEVYRRSLDIRERVLGKDHPEVAKSLNRIALLHTIIGRYIEAEPLYKRALEIMEKGLGKEHPEVEKGLNMLALLYFKNGRYAEAEPLQKRVFEIREKLLGEEHPDVAKSIDFLAELYINLGRPSEAETLYKKALEIREKVLDNNDPDLEVSFHKLLLFYLKAGKHADAALILNRFLGIKEKTLGSEHLDIAFLLGGLADTYIEMDFYAEAEALLKRAIKIQEGALGKDHPNIVSNLNILGKFYSNTGKYLEAENLYKKALEIKERALGKDHPDLRKYLNNLALLYHETGRYLEAETLYKRSLEIEGTLDEHHLTEIILGNLAILYSDMGKFSEAESLLKLALEKMKDLNKEHFRVGEIFGLLGDIYVRGGKYAEAESMLNQSLEILSKVLGKDHSRVGTILQSLASLYSHTGKYAEAETLLKRSLEINERVFGKDHPEVARNNINLALLYAEMSRHHESHGMFTFGISIKDKNRENIFLLLPEKQKLNYFEKSKGGIHAFILHTALYMQTSDRAIRDTFDAWLRWKGSVTEAQGRYIDALTQSGNPEIQKKFEELNNLRRKIARLQLSGPGKKNPEEYEKGLEELERKKGPIEVELSSLSKDFALEKMVGRADTKRLSEILVKKGKNSVYIDFADIGGIYDFKEKKPGKSIYLAFVLLPEKEPLVKLINISDTEGVDKHIRTYLEEIKRSMEYGEVPRERILRSESRALYELLLKPIETEIKGKKHLYISPDGNLNLIPFEVLMTPEGKFLMEDYTISYIAAGRDIVRFADTNVARGEPLIMADPNYDMGLNEKTEVAKALGVIETRGPAPLSRDAKDLRFKRLPDTKQEADAIEKCLRESLKINVRNYQDKSALEEILLTAKSPRLLHLATHGYFLRDEEVKHQPMLGFMTQERERMVDIGIENPMLRSGIVLAGVNASLKEGRDDGVVSAEKILGLRLKGTDLVVLSACDTGTGEVKSGEGVFGLKRSFILSGAKTVVMSLWSIPSKETTELMTDFYTLMAKGKTKAEALREARLNLMKKKPNPFYWGAFIMVGNPN